MQFLLARWTNSELHALFSYTPLTILIVETCMTKTLIVALYTHDHYVMGNYGKSYRVRFAAVPLYSDCVDEHKNELL